jgi:hypothetical protein
VELDQVDFLGNELLRRLHDNSYPVPRQSTVRFCMATEELNCLERYSLLVWWKTVLRRCSHRVDRDRQTARKK